MIFQRYVFPLHHSVNEWQFLNENYCIGRGGEATASSESRFDFPGLISLGSLGHMENLIYKTPINSEKELTIDKE